MTIDVSVLYLSRYHFRQPGLTRISDITDEKYLGYNRPALVLPCQPVGTPRVSISSVDS